MKKSIFIKIFSGYFLSTVVLSLFIFIFSFNTIKHYYVNTLTNDLKDLCAAITPQAASLIQENKFAELDLYIKNLDIITHKRITIINFDGRVLADSEKDPAQMANHKNRPEVIAVLNGTTGTSIRFSSTIKADMLYVAVPLKINGKPVYVVRVSLFIKDINNLLSEIKRHIAAVTFLVLIITLIGAFIFSKSLSIPIKKLMAAAQKVAEGDFNIKVSLKNNDELKKLSESFNDMTQQINILFKEISHQKDELSVIINSIPEGLFVFDNKDVIQLMNDSFKKICQNRRSDGKFYWEIFRDSEFKELLSAVKINNTSRAIEIEHDKKTYLCSITMLPSKDEYIAVLNDITQIKELDNKKKDLVANVSHELRTPLTAIKGFSEALEEEATEKGKHYIDVIEKHTQRLIRIVEDLLLLSEVEDKGMKLEISKTDMKELIEKIIKIFESDAKEKGIGIKIDAQNFLKEVNVDAFKIEQVFINLIDNAVKYMEKGDINISLQQNDNTTTINISDTGIGIPQESLPHIFERFYVVDKSRSRKAGGTGLGLSIVKHIILLHNGTINVNSELGKGTQFTIVLPNF